MQKAYGGMASMKVPYELSSLFKAQFVCIAIVLASLAYVICKVTYNIYLHPLSSYPGSKVFAASDIPYVHALLTGNLTRSIQELHRKYGDVVRIAPNELSYNCANAWEDIYGHRLGRPLMEKSAQFYSQLIYDGAQNILTASPAEHSKIRRVLSHAFSEKAMREQEPFIKIYVDLLIQRLKESDGEPTDMVKWFNWTTFDLFGDLCFGESFQCLELVRYHPWVAILFESIKLSAIQSALVRHPLLNSLAAKLTPASLLTKKEEHVQLATAKVAKRMELANNRADLMSYMLKNKDQGGMSDAEIMSNAAVMVIAGSETTATAMSGATYLLLKHPEVLKKLTKVIREEFASQDEITIQSASNIPYLLAVLDESLRCYPPVAVGLPRTVPSQGDMIAGKWVPGKTIVSINPVAACGSPKNFALPSSFIPERWTGSDPRFLSDKLPACQAFSIGPSNCIGRNFAYAEMRLIMSRIIWNFDLEAGPGLDGWDKQKMYTLWEKGALMVKLILRRD